MSKVEFTVIVLCELCRTPHFTLYRKEMMLVCAGCRDTAFISTEDVDQ